MVCESMKQSSLEGVHYPAIETTHFEMSVAGTEESGFQDKANMLKVHKASRHKQLPPTTTTMIPTSAPNLPPFSAKRFKTSTDESRSLTIYNSHSSLMALIDTVYPPLHCTACDHVSFTTEEARRHQHRQALLCLHPHCEKIFRTRTALLFHIQHSHLVVQATLATAPPLISCATSSSCSSSSLSSFSSSSSPTTATATATTLTNMISSFPSAIYAGDDDVDDNDDENDDDKDSQNRSLSSSPSLQAASSFCTLVPTLSPPKKPRSPTWRVSSFSKIQTSRAPRGSKKIVLSPDIDARLNAVYHPLQCPSCLKHFKRKTNVIKHLTDDHYGEEPYRCIFPECSHPKLYATREGLVYHILRAHDACSSSQAQQQQHSSTPASFSKRKL